jgi:uncharacterized membrane protein YdbT with pleckstrin-like domain
MGLVHSCLVVAADGSVETHQQATLTVSRQKRKENKMSYIRENLLPNEKILFFARVHPAIFLPSIFSLVITAGFVINAISTASRNDETSGITAGFSLLISGLFFLLAIRVGLEALIIILTTEFAVTNRRVIAKTGFIRRRTLEMLLPKVESIAVYQHLIGRLFNFGSVTVVGTGGTRERFRAIAEPNVVRKKINQIIENYTQVDSQHQLQR